MYVWDQYVIGLDVAGYHMHFLPAFTSVLFILLKDDIATCQNVCIFWFAENIYNFFRILDKMKMVFHDSLNKQLERIFCSLKFLVKFFVSAHVLQILNFSTDLHKFLVGEFMFGYLLKVELYLWLAIVYFFSNYTSIIHQCSEHYFYVLKMCTQVTLVWLFIDTRVDCHCSKRVP